MCKSIPFILLTWRPGDFGIRTAEMYLIRVEARRRFFEENQTRNLGTGGGHGMRGKYQVVFLALLAVGLLVAPLTARAGTIQFTGTDVKDKEL